MPTARRKAQSRPLTKRQRAFISEYLIDFNASRAARDAGYSERTAAVVGSENLRKPKIAAEIEKALSERAMSADEVLARLADLGRASLAPFVREFDEHGRPVFDFSTDEAKAHLHTIRSLRISSKGRPRVQLHDSLSALQQLAKVHALTKESTTVSVRVDLGQLSDEQLIDRVLDRVDRLGRIAEGLDSDAMRERVQDYRRVLTPLRNGR